MKGKISALLVSVVLIFSVIVVGQLVFSAKSAYAADTASDMETLKAKVIEAFKTNPTNFTINYTGTMTSTFFKEVIDSLFEDEYLQYSTKTYNIKYTGTTGNYTITFPFTYWETAAERATVHTKVTEILANIITPDMDDFSKEKAIHDWIVKNVAYDTTLKKHSAIAALTAPYTTVCQGYALLAYKMLTDSGLEAHIVEGTARGISHTWILVKVDGQWYHLDPTWDDPVPDIANRIVYPYYNLTDEQIRVDHIWKATVPRTYPLATTDFQQTLTNKKTSDTDNLALYEGLEESLGYKYLLDVNTLSSKEDIISIIQKAMASSASNESTVSFRYMKMSQFAADLKTAASTFSNILKYSYTSESFTRTVSSADGLVNLSITNNTPVPVTEINLSKSEATVKVKGATATLTATVSPANATNKTVIWKSSDSAIATVTQKGVVTGVKAGTVTVSVYASGGDNLFGTSDITVLEGVTGITVNKKALSVKVGTEDSSIIAKVAPVSATVQEITYTSNKPLIAAVDFTTGVITGVSPGVATITAKTKDGNKTVAITVTVPVNVTDITLDKTEYFIPVAKTATAKPVILPLKATLKTVTWDTSDHNVATVNAKGIITASSTSGGYTILTGTTVDEGKTVTAAVYTVVPVQSIVFSPKSAFVKVGETLSVSPIFKPSDATIQDVIYKSSKPNIAKVSESGVIEGVAVGAAVITATTREGKKVASINVTVPTNATDLVLNKSGEVQINIGKPLPLKATIQPLKATNKLVKWSSSDETIATVGKTGIVTGIAPGNATITATADDDNTIKQSVTVAVYKPLVSVKFSKSTLVLKYHTSDSSVKATYLNEDATLADGAIVYSSSNTSAVTVNSVTGEVYGAGGGTAKITVTITAHDVVKTAAYTVTVPYPVLAITINKGNEATVVKNKTLALAAIFNPVNAANKGIAWTSSNETVATVNLTTGLVKAGNVTGTTVIRATSAYDSNLIAEITIHVP